MFGREEVVNLGTGAARDACERLPSSRATVSLQASGPRQRGNIRHERAQNEQILVSFTDTSIGLPLLLVEHIFEPLFTTQTHGTGMGLRISRSIIESHGGRLWAESSAAQLFT